MPTNETRFLEDMTARTSDDEIMRLDSVDGTILYMRADLVRQGLIFPTFYLIGTNWNISEGWDGIETEGVCYIARTLGYDCFGLCGGWFVQHS